MIVSYLHLQDQHGRFEHGSALHSEALHYGLEALS
jgi:hypothetical protein